MEKTPMEPTRMVWPSASALATNSAAMAPLAPGLFSTTPGWPSSSWNLAAIARPTMSEEPPATNGITTRIGFVGNDCALAAPVAASRHNDATRRFISVSWEGRQFSHRAPNALEFAPRPRPEDSSEDPARPGRMHRHFDRARP